MNIVWRKVWPDLWHHKLRTLMVVMVAFLSTLASLWPALRATRVSVRESPAYE